MTYSWPGNVRQLENMIRNTVVLNNASWIERKMLPPFPTSQTFDQPISQADKPMVNENEVLHGGTSNTAFGTSNIEPLWVVEKRYIEKAISACNDNVPKAAALLDISPSTIYRKMKTWEQMVEQA